MTEYNCTVNSNNWIYDSFLRKTFWDFIVLILWRCSIYRQYYVWSIYHKLVISKKVNIFFIWNICSKYQIHRERLNWTGKHSSQIHEHIRAERTMFNCVLIVGQMYMKLTYFIYDINNYTFLLRWRNFILTPPSSS